MPEGNKHVLGLREGSTEAARVVRSLLADLIERGLDAERMRLWVIDGGKALRKAIVECFGATALIQRCQEHKRRNVIEHLPEELHASVDRALRDAWDGADADAGEEAVAAPGASSARPKHPGAAASLKEGLEETLTVQGMGITGALYRTLRTTNPIENLNGSIAHYTRNVKRLSDNCPCARPGMDLDRPEGGCPTTLEGGNRGARSGGALPGCYGDSKYAAGGRARAPGVSELQELLALAA